MKLKNWLGFALLSISCLAHAAPQQALIDLSQDFVQFYDASASLPSKDRVAQFKQLIAPKMADYYGIARWNGKRTQAQQDEIIADAIQTFPEIRQNYLSKAQQFKADYNKNITSFTQHFPDFTMDVPVYLLHSLGEMDGGTRSFGNQLVLMFGVDGMVRYHADSKDESAFFHHELFHVYHRQFFQQCEVVWCPLWNEGLAVYASSLLNPSAGPVELLLDSPKGMSRRTNAVLSKALEQLQTQLLSTRYEDYVELMQMGPESSDLPKRRGYLLSYYIAREIGKTHSIDQLARMPGEQVLPLMQKALASLIEQAKQGKLALLQ